RAQERAPDAAVFMLAACSPGAPAVAQGNPAALEVAEEFFPFGVGRGAVFFGGAKRAAAGDERPVPVDRFLGVDGLVSHGGVDVPVAQYELGDVGRHAVED